MKALWHSLHSQLVVQRLRSPSPFLAIGVYKAQTVGTRLPQAPPIAHCKPSHGLWANSMERSNPAKSIQHEQQVISVCEVCMHGVALGTAHAFAFQHVRTRMRCMQLPDL